MSDATPPTSTPGARGAADARAHRRRTDPSTGDRGPTSGRVVVMTGGTHGIGAHALRSIAADPGTTVVVGARGGARPVPAGVEVLPLDLASLAEVRAFAAAVVERLHGRPVDVLVLNAGTQSADQSARTVDGFETTFAVNHLAHYLLARLLTPHLAPHARVVLTTSDTHDRAVTPLAPRSLDPGALAHPRGRRPGAGMRAYTSSKLCNLLTARSLAASAELDARDVRVVAFNPGFTIGTNLGGRSARSQRIMATVVVPVFGVVGRFKPEYTAGRPERAGQVLADLATGALTPPPDRLYVSVLRGEVTYPDPAALALDDHARDDLWRRSAAMVDLPVHDLTGTGTAA